MRVKTNQETSFIDVLVTTPENDLDHLHDLVDWKDLGRLLRVIEGDYAALSMFKLILLQTWHNLSDERVTQAVCRDIVFMRFCGFSLEGKKPNAGTLCRFRNRLIQEGLLSECLNSVNRGLESQGLKLQTGKYVSSDATLIRSSRRAKKVYKSDTVDDAYEVTDIEYSDDKDASWLKKGSSFTYGYSASVTTDEYGLVDSVSTFSANESEMKRFTQVLDESDLRIGQKMLYDKGVDSANNREALSIRQLKDGIMRKKPKGKRMSYWQSLRNKLISKKRFVTERTFGTLKRTYGLSRARYLGLEKVHAEVLLKSIAYNLRRGVNQYLA